MNLFSVHHCLLGFIFSKENWLNLCLFQRLAANPPSWIHLYHSNLLSISMADNGHAVEHQSRMWVWVHFIHFLSDSKQVKAVICNLQASADHMTSLQSADNTKEAHAAKTWNIQSSLSRATICQATLSFQGKPWAENDIIARLGEVWTHDPCWMCLCASVGADLL